MLLVRHHSKPLGKLDIGECYRFEVTPKPQWTWKGFPHSEGLVLLESLGGNLWYYGSTGLGGLQGEKIPGVSNINGIGKINTLSGLSGHYFVETSTDAGVIRILGEDWSVEDLIPYYDRESDDGELLKSLLDWMPLEGGEILGIGLTQDTGGNWSSDFLFFDSFSPSQYKKLLELPVESFPYYTLGHSYFANVNDKGVFLVVDQTLEIYEFVNGETEQIKLLSSLEKLKAKYKPPTLPEIRLSTTADAYRAVEAASYPTALIGWDNHIYILFREPKKNDDRTKWSLYLLDAGTGEIISEQVLPTESSHIVLIPGAQHWFLLEKGDVEEFGKQQTKNLVAIPSDRIASSPIEAALSNSICGGQHNG